MIKDTDHQAAAELWDKQYCSGDWEYLRKIEQLPRYALISGWIEHLIPAGKILDVGCGEGILLEWLRSYKHYEGLDISQIAIAKAESKFSSNDNRTFHCASAESFYKGCAAHFDCIIFNEVIYCCSNPIRLLTSYERLLNSGGYLIVSVTGFEPAIWKDIQTMYGNRLAHYVRIEDCKITKSWNLMAIKAPN